MTALGIDSARARTRTRPLRFHWSIPQLHWLNEELEEVVRGSKSHAQTIGRPDARLHSQFCRQAEDMGIDSLLIPIGFQRAEPVTFAAGLGALTDRIRFMLAFRSGVVSPTYFVQQVNTVSVITGGRVTINAVAGHSKDEQLFFGDLLPHDERYKRTAEFFDICLALWRGDGPVDYAGRYFTIEGARVNTPFTSPDRTRPEIYLGGQSAEALELAAKYADCHLRFADHPDRLAEEIRPSLDRGLEVGLIMSVILKPTRDEAVRHAEELLARAGEQARDVQKGFRSRSDSVGFNAAYQMAEDTSAWLTDYLWIGSVPYLGPPAISIVGTPEDVARGLLEFRRAGVSQFIFQGRPDYELMTMFGREVIPRVRAAEQAD